MTQPLVMSCELVCFELGNQLTKIGSQLHAVLANPKHDSEISMNLIRHLAPKIFIILLFGLIFCGMFAVFVVIIKSLKAVFWPAV